MANEYDGILAEMDAEEPAAPAASEYDSLLQEVLAEDAPAVAPVARPAPEAAKAETDSEDDSLRQLFAASTEQGAEKDANIKALARVLDVPEEVIAARPEEFRRLWEASAFHPNKLPPGIRRLALERPDLGIVRDKQLTLTEKALNALADFGDAFDSGGVGPGGTTPESRAKVREEMRTRPGEHKETLTRDQVSMKVEEMGAAGALLKPGIRFMEARHHLETSKAYSRLLVARMRGADTQDLEREIAQMERSAVTRDLGEMGVLEQQAANFGSGMASQVETLKGLGVVGGTAAALTYAGASVLPATRPVAGKLALKAGGLFGQVGVAYMALQMETGDAYSTLLRAKTDEGQPLSHDEAAGGALLYGAGATGLEMASLGLLLKSAGPLGEMLKKGATKAVLADLVKDKAFRTIAAKVGKAWAKAGAGEVTEEFLQAVLKDAVTYASKSAAAGADQGGWYAPQSGPAVDWKNALNEAEAALPVAFFGPAAMGASVNLTTHAYARDKALLAGKQVEALSGLAESPTVRAAPEAVAKMVEEATAKSGNPLTHLYVDPLAFITYFQGEHADATAAATEMLGEDGPKLLQEAMLTGGRLEVPLAAYLEKWGPSGIGKALERDTATRADQPTRVDQEKQQAEDAQVDELAAKFEKEGVQPQSVAESKFIEAMEKQLAAIGTVNKKDARTQIQLLRAMVRTVPERFGAGISADQLFQNFALAIGKQTAPVGIASAKETADVQPGAMEALRKDFAGMGREGQVRALLLDRNTGLLNSRGFRALRRDPERTHLAEFDLEGKKFFNDEHGHESVDGALRIMGRALSAAGIKDGAAISGAVKAWVASPEQAAELAATMEAAVNEGRPAEERVRVTAGTAEARDDSAMDGLFEAADTAHKAEKDRLRFRKELGHRKGMPQSFWRQDAPEANWEGVEGAPGLSLKSPEFKALMKEAAGRAAPLAQRFKDAPRVDRFADDFDASGLTDELREFADEFSGDWFDAIYRDETGMLTDDGFARARELDPKAFVVSADMRGLKDLNEMFGKAGADVVLDTFKELIVENGGAKFDAAHPHGDEFFAQGNDEREIKKFFFKLEQVAAKRVFVQYQPGGGGILQVGVHFAHGLGKTLDEADRIALPAAKEKQGDVAGPVALTRRELDRRLGELRAQGYSDPVRIEAADAERLRRSRGGVRPAVSIDELTPEVLTDLRETIKRMQKKKKNRAAATGFLEYVLDPESNSRPFDLEPSMEKWFFDEYGIFDPLQGEPQVDLRTGRVVIGGPKLKPADTSGKKKKGGGGRQSGELLKAKLQRVMSPEEFMALGYDAFKQPVYHGTPHRDVDRFSLEKIGTGEGNQAFGWGLYFAGKKAVAEFYRRMLAKTPEWSELPEAPADSTAANLLRDVDPTDLKAVEAKIHEAKGHYLRGRAGRYIYKFDDGSLIQLSEYKAEARSDIKEKGQTFKVDVPEDSELLDYDTPLSEQPEAVRAILEKAIPELGFKKLDNPDLYWKQTGGDWYKHVSALFPDGDKDASEYLRSVGIPGLRYLDQDSRAGDEGSHNYVIWQEDRIEIQERLYQSKAPVTESPEFKAWFKDSKVVDAQGGPLRVFHVTDQDFSTFEPRLRGNDASGQIGSWFTDQASLLEKRGNQLASSLKPGALRTVPAFLSIQNPLRLPTRGALDMWIAEQDARLPVSVLAELKEAHEAFKDDPDFDFTYTAEDVDRYDSDPEVRARIHAYVLADAYHAKDATALVKGVAERSGYDGVVIDDDLGHGRAFVAFEPTQIKSATGNRGAFDPNDPNILNQDSTTAADEARGYTAIAQKGLMRIFRVALNKNADPSTFLHESAHVFLELFGDLAARPDAPQQMRDDYAKTLEWFGVASREDVKVEHHEKWARGFEAYLMEGKAPSVALAGAFQAFKSWLKNIYRSIAALNVELNDDVRGIFDRLLATDREIEAMSKRMGVSTPLFRSPDEMGKAMGREVPPEEWQAYLEEHQDAHAHAVRALELRVIKDRLRASEAWWKDEERRQREVAAAEYEALPARLAHQFVHGKAATGASSGVIHLDRAVVEAVVGADNARKFPLRKKGGIHPGEIAGFFGFETGEDMLGAITRLPTKDAWAKERAAEVMRERFPELLDEQEALQEEAAKGLHGEFTAKWLLRELQALGSKITAEQIKRAARQIADARRVGRLDVGGVLTQERSLANQAVKAVAKGDMARAAGFKVQQLVNVHLHRELTKAREDREAFLDLAGDLSRPSARAKMGKASPVYRDGVDLILESLGLKEPSSTETAGSVEQVVSMMEADGATVMFDVEQVSALVNKGGAWKGLTVAEMRAVRDALKNIQAAVRAKTGVLVEGRRVEKAQVIEQLVAEAASVLRDQGPATTRESETLGERIKRTGGAIDGWMLRVETMVGFLVKDDINSMWFKAVILPLQEAKHRETDLLSAAVRPIVEAFEKVPKSTRARFMEPVDGAALFPGHREDLTPPRRRFELLMLALNYGNEGNAQRLLDGRGISDQEVRAAIDLLTKEELDWVQSVWDASETKHVIPGETEAKSLKERSFDLEERDSGLRPKAVEARALQTKHGTYRGGYFPAVYHSEVETVGKKQDAQSVAEMLDPSYVRPGTPHGHLKKRVEKFAGALSLSPGTIYSHLAKTVHDVAYREALKSVGGLILSPDIQDALRARLGAEKTKLFLPWLRDVGTMRSGMDWGGLNAVAQWARSNMAPALLGWRPSIAIGDAANLAVSGLDLNPLIYAGALKEFSTDINATTEMILTKSGEMRSRRDQLVRDFARAVKDLTASGPFKRGPLAAYKHHGFTFMEWSDRLTSAPSWLAAYRQAEAEGKSELEAVRLADKFVRDRFPSYNAVDVSHLLRDKGFWGAVTVFGSYVNVLYNRQRHIIQPWLNAQGWEKAALSAPVVGKLLALWAFGNVIAAGLMGQGPEKDEPWWQWFLRRLTLAPFENFHAELGGTVGSLLTGKKPNARGSPISSYLETVGGAALRAVDGDADGAAQLKALVQTIGLSKGLPMTPVNNAIDLLTGPPKRDENALDVAGTAIYGDRRTGNPLSMAADALRPE
jgi:GGDEF domain-containing protein